MSSMWVLYSLSTKSSYGRVAPYCHTALTPSRTVHTQLQLLGQGYSYLSTEVGTTLLLYHSVLGIVDDSDTVFAFGGITLDDRYTI